MPTMSAKRDHPRMYGEHYKHRGSITPNPGSSPHVRGALAAYLHSAVAPGIIPACAGSTDGNVGPATVRRDHPRMCGEHQTGCAQSIQSSGSSPHVRGALARLPAWRACHGIIPACAGSTEPLKPPRIVPGDHPRMCGEHMRNRRSTRRQKGSSPHVRGALPQSYQPVFQLGIIPACAGSTAWPSGRPRPHRDHPRMCGEHIASPLQVACFSGSSPHVRGAPCGSTASTTNTGIIPACAGSTVTPCMLLMTCRDHPRMCGEHLSCA